MLPWWLTWAEAGDVCAFDAYPTCTTTTTYDTGQRSIPYSMTQSLVATGQQKPIPYLCQAYSQDQASGRYCVPARPAPVHDLHCLCWRGHGDSVFRGGLLVLCAGGSVGVAPNSPADWGGCAQLGWLPTRRNWPGQRRLERSSTAINSQLHALEPVLFSPTSTMQYQVYLVGAAPGTTPIRCILKQVDNDWYLIAVNVTSSKIQGRFYFPSAISNVTEWLPGLTAPTVGSHFFIDSFPAWGVRIYKFAVPGSAPRPLAPPAEQPVYAYWLWSASSPLRFGERRGTCPP